MMPIRRPPPHLGLGTPFNLASASVRTRPLVTRTWWLPAVLGVVTPMFMLAMDLLLFDGASLERVRAHVANLPDVAHPVARALTLNGAAGLVLGWMYWWRGLEMAILTHMVAIAVLYIGVPPFL